MKNSIKDIFRKSKSKIEIVNREELIKMIDDNRLCGIETENNHKENEKNQVIMKSKDINTIFKFAKENNIHTIFFQYYYYDKEYFKIDLVELEKEYPKEILNIMEKDIIDYNNKVDKIDFETPIMLKIYCLYNGFSITLEMKEEWGETYKEDIVSGVKQMEILFEKYQKRLENYINEQEELREVELEKLKQIIFKDEKFQISTNKELRYAYINNFLKKNSKYWNLFGEHGTEVYRWIETIWREYKEKRNNDK